MNEEIGAKGGKKDRKLTFLNKKRKIQLRNKELEQLKEKEISKNEKLKKDEILLQQDKSLKEEFLLQQENSLELESNIKDVSYQEQIKDSFVKPHKAFNNDEIKTSGNIINIEDKKEEKVVSRERIKLKAKERENTTLHFPTTDSKDVISEKQKNDIEKFLENQVIMVLEHDIDEKRFQLKKIDSEIHAIQKSIDSANDKEELEDLQEEIDRVMDMLEQIRRQILSLEKTFDLKFPVEEPDNYLIYLVDEYKEQLKEEKEFYKKLEENKEFKSLMATIIEIEEKQEILQEKMNTKKDELELEEDDIEKLNNDVIDLEEINERIKTMLDNHEKMIEEIKQKVNETVHITDRVEFISKSVDHTMLDLFLLMAVLKHNLSIKNNAVAAATAAMALNAIIKMTTPIQEKVIVKDCDVSDYEEMIHNCMNDTGLLEKIISNNLDSISSIRYTFENDYGSCSHLPSYKEAISKLDSLEMEMEERKMEVAKMKKEIDLQLEKNNAKVKKYGSIKAA